MGRSITIRKSLWPAAILLCAGLLSSVLWFGRTNGSAQEATLEAAQSELKKGNYPAAITAFTRLTAAKPADDQALDGLLQAWFETGRYAEAEAAAKKFLTSTNEAPAIRIALGEIYAATGRYREAIDEFDRAGRQAPTSERLRASLRRAEILKMTGRGAEAETIFKSLESHLENNRVETATDLVTLARALTHLEQYKEANDLYLEAIDADKTAIEAHLGGGELFTTKYNYAEAADFFKDALAINPNSARAHLGVAANRRIDGGDEAQAALGRALEINPNLVEAIVLSATLDLEAQHAEKASARIEQALRINPQSLDAHALRAAIHFQQHRMPELESEIKTTLAINPQGGELYETLSHFATLTRRYEQAVAFSRRAIELSPRLWPAHLSLGMGLLRLGQHEAGRAAIEASFKGDPYNVWAKNTLDLLDSMAEFKETRHGSFVIKTAAKESDVLGAYAGALLEEAMQKLSAKYKFTPQGPVVVEIFDNHEDFAVRALGLPGLGALGVCFGRVIAQDSPSARPAGQFNWGSTLWHEFTHVMTLQMTDHLIPRWFSEGLSVFEERRARPGWGDDWNPMALRALTEGRWFKIADLDAGFMRPKRADDVQLAYFEASQICEFIAERYGFDAILQMLAAYRDKKKTPEILQSTLKLSESDFDRAFNEYVRGKVGPWLKAFEAGAEKPAGRMSKDETVAAARQNPNHLGLQLRAGAALAEAGSTDQAITFLKRGIELFPLQAGPGNAYEQLAEIYEKNGDRKAAAEMLNALVKIDENNLTALKKLISLRTELGEKAGALEALQMSFYLNPFESGAHALAGALLLEANDAERATGEMKMTLALDPPNPAEAYYQLARAHLAAGRTAEARRAVLRSLEAAPAYEQAQELLLKLTRPE